MIRQKRKIIYILLSVLLIMPLAACGENKAFINTEIKYNVGTFDVFDETYAVHKGNDSTTVYEIKQKSGKLVEYYSIDGNCALVDANGGKALFKGSDGYFIFDIAKKKTTQLDSMKFPLVNEYSDVSYRFSNDGNKIIAVKILKDKNNPVSAGTLVLGYELKPESGIYIYSASNGKEIAKAIIEDFGISTSVKLEVEVCLTDSSNIGVVLRCCAIGTSFADEHYYTMNLNDGKPEKLGKYSYQESLDVVSNTFNFNGCYVNMNSQAIKAVDFVNKSIIDKDIPTNNDSSNRNIYIEENGRFFVLYYPNGDETYEKYTITSEGYIKTQNLSAEEFGKYNYFKDSCSLGSRVQLSQEYLEKYSDKNFGEKVYKTYNEDCFIAEFNDMACIVYKK